MITTLPREELIQDGMHIRADYLIEQAGYTIGIATADGPPLADLLPEGYLAEVDALLDDLRSARKDKSLMVDDARNATKEQNKALKDAKVWRRKASRRARRAVRMGYDMPRELLTYSSARSIPSVEGQMDEMTKLFEANISKMPGKDAQELLDEGKAIATALKNTDAEQEIKRLNGLPAATQELLLKKGTLYTALKVINDAGHELFADNSTQAARYNLSILYRRTTRGGGDTPADASGA